MFYLSVPFDFYSSGVLEAFAKTMGRKECLEAGLVGPCPTALVRGHVVVECNTELGVATTPCKFFSLVTSQCRSVTLFCGRQCEVMSAVTVTLLLSHFEIRKGVSDVPTKPLFL